jgi:hypothetical protein
MIYRVVARVDDDALGGALDGVRREKSDVARLKGIFVCALWLARLRLRFAGQ